MTTDASHTAYSDIIELDAVALSKAIRSQEISCVETLNAFLQHIDTLNPKVNALVAMQDRNLLHQQAQEYDTLLARGNWLGPLHGFPQAPKDVAPAAGLVTSRGSLIFKDQVSTTDAIVFERMRRAGALFIGRTNTPELSLGGHSYNKVYGTTYNAFDVTKSAGGSSGGAGVAVALRMLPVADGTDMMGSLRTPAAFNNVYGLRTSFGCVPNGPTDEVFYQQFSVAGPMARNIPDLALLLSVQAGFDPRLPLSRHLAADAFTTQIERDFRGARVGWLGNLGGHLPTDLGLLELCEKALDAFKDIGCHIEPVLPDFDMKRLWRAWLDLRSFSVAGSNGSLYNDPSQRVLLKPEAIWEIEHGQSLSGSDVFSALRDRSAWYQTLRELFEHYDFLVMPGSQVFPFNAEQPWPTHVADQEMDHYHRWLEATIPATMAGLPALCAPAGFSPEGLPAGLQIIGPAHADWDVLQFGHAYDQASGHARIRSPLLS